MKKLIIEKGPQKVYMEIFQLKHKFKVAKSRPNIKGIKKLASQVENINKHYKVFI